MQVAAIPTGPLYYQPITAVPPVAPVKAQTSGSDEIGKLRAAPPPGIGSLLDIEA